MLGLGSMLVAIALVNESLSVDSVSPTHGAAAGGDTVSAFGKGFFRASSVQFVRDGAHVDIAFVVVTDRELRFTSPALVAGRTYGLRVRTTTDEDVTLDNAFTYDAAPPTASHILTESGDRLLTESGDALITES